MTTQRLTISLKPEVVEKLDKLKTKAGLSRSAIITSLINQAVFTDEITAAQMLEVFENDERFVEVIKSMAAK